MQYQTDVHKIFARYFKGTEMLAWALSKKLSEGNICLNMEEYKSELPGILKEQKAKASFKDEDAIFWADPSQFENQCLEGPYVTHSPAVLKPFMVLDGRAYLHRYFQYETRIIEDIVRLGENFRIITGGPGTGKTHGVATILTGLYKDNQDLKVAMAAPTAKAASRMNESIRGFAMDSSNIPDDDVRSWLTGLKSQTLHRLMGYIPDSVFFRHNKENPLPYDVLIIDECSMVDVALMAKLLDAVSGHTRIYLLGDKDQLASVEAGSVFGDLCRAGDSSLLQGKVETKTISYRFDPDQGIGLLSREVIAGKCIDIEEYANDGQVRIDTGFSNDLFEEYAGKYLYYLNEPDVKTALQKLNQVRFLCVTRENEHSVAEVNRRIERFLARVNQDFKPRSPGFYHNQPVIITQNDYNLQIFNGEVGLIRKEGEAFYFWFYGPDGEVKKVQAGYLNHCETVFAMTIHKSQGSEFEHVVVILPDQQGEKLLTRELLYTAVTRAKSSVLVQTAKKSLDKCTGRAVSRASGIEKRLKS